MLSETTGQLLALGTAFCWTTSSVAFETAGRRVGSLPTNLIRLSFALVMLCAWCTIARGHPLPTDAPPHTWWWLTLSGVVGFFIGDLTLFRAFVLIGARLSSLIMSLAPPMAAVVAWLWLDEHIGGWGWAGMAVTLAGIAWVVSERRPAGPPHPIGDAEADALASSAPALGLSPPEKSYEPPAPGVRSTYLTGLLLAFVGAAGQAVGLVMSRRGMELADGAKFDPFAATQIRAIAGVIGFALVVTFAKRWRDIGKALRDTKAVGCMALGATFGPFLGVSLLLAASQRIPTGLAQTIVATVPVLMIPVSLARGTERVTWRAALGAIVTVAGVAILMLTRLDEAARNAR